MRKTFTTLFILFFINLTYSQTYKCGVTVDNYILEPNYNYIKSICSDRNGNIFYIRNSAIYKNKTEWINYKPGGSTRYFSFPFSITTDKLGNVYVFDAQKYALYKITPTGVVSLVAGVEGQSGYKDTIPTKSLFSSAVNSICADSSGNIYLAEQHKIRKVGTKGYVATFAGQVNSGYVNAQGKNAAFNYLTDITCDKNGNIYTVESNNYVIRKVTADSIVSDYAGGKAIFDYVDDNGLKAGFGYMTGIHYGHDNYIYVSEYSGSRIRRIAPNGDAITLAGYNHQYAGSSYNSAVGAGYLVGIVNPSFITQTPDGKIHVLAEYYGSYSSQEYQVIRSISVSNSCESENKIVSTVCGDGYMMTTTTGNGRATEFEYINAIARDKSGNLYIAEQNTSNILKMLPNGDVTIFYTAGTNQTATALAVSDAGLVYAAMGNKITVINADGTYNKNLYDKPGDNFYVTRMVFDKNGDLLFTDRNFDNVRRMNVSTGVYSTIAGGTATGVTHSQQGYVDGAAVDSRFSYPYGIDIDKDGNIFIADMGNGAVRKINTLGQVSTIAGGPYGSADGKGKLAQFGTIYGLQVDAAGSIYVADYEFNLIKKITFPDTNVVTIAGNVYPNDDNSCRYIDGKASISRFNYPLDLAMDKVNNELYVADELNSVVRKISGLNLVTTAIIPSFTTTQPNVIHFSPNPSSQSIHFDKERSYTIYDLNSKKCLSGIGSEANVSELPNGMYLILFDDLNVAEKFIKN